MGDELFDPWFEQSDIDAMRYGYDVPRKCWRAGYDFARSELEAELATATQQLADMEHGWNEEQKLTKQIRDRLDKARGAAGILLAEREIEPMVSSSMTAWESLQQALVRSE